MQGTVGTQTRGLKARIVSGSVVMLSGSTLAVAINLAYNVAVAHFLGPKGFGNANALYTLLTLMSAVTLSFQIITTKFIAKSVDSCNRDDAYRVMHRAAWGSGLALAMILCTFRVQVSNYLDLPGGNLVAILAVGAAFYVPLGCRRGYIQGAFGFQKLATNLVLEGVARLTGSLILIAFGFGVVGVIIANSAAMAVAYWAITPKLGRRGDNPISTELALREISHAIVFFAGQVLINNCDIVLVKHFFAPGDAGLYAAIAMVGRVTFSCSSAIVNGMFPVIAGSKHEERRNLSLIGTALLLVFAVGSALALGLRFAPSGIWTLLFGASFQISGPHGFPYLLSLYCITTTVYCLSVVVMTYEMSYKIANTNWLQLVFSAVLIACICKYHASLQQVIVVQLILLTAFLAAITIPFFIDMRRNQEAAPPGSPRKLRLIRGLSQDEVISGFLKSEFKSHFYSDYHSSMREIVFSPDHNDPTEQGLRRSLLDIRHRALWREIPKDTEWFQVEVTTSDLEMIRVFPRAQWVRISKGNFSAQDVIDRIERHRDASDPFVKKISELRKHIAADILNTGPVILIGLGDKGPFTILDGNHRFVAAVLEGTLDRLTFVCGISERMTSCCWYKTDVFTLARYSRNLIQTLFKKPNQVISTPQERAIGMPEEVSCNPVL